MDNNYKAYVQKYHFIDNPETDALLERLRTTLQTNAACARILEVFISELKGTYAERLAGLGTYLKTEQDNAKNKLGNLYRDDDMNNTLYPFGRLSRMYPVGLGVCSGKMKIEKVLSKAEEQCEKMIKAFSDNVDKTILIFTDKWDGPLFQKYYAATFIRYANEHNIMFLFLQVTDFGVWQIPFLTLNRTILSKRKNWDINWGTNHKRNEKKKEKLVKLRDNMKFLYNFEYLVEYQDHAHSCPVCWMYEFDFWKQECTIYRTATHPELEGYTVVNIPITAINTFIREVIELKNRPEGCYYVSCFEPNEKITCHARFKDKEFQWDTPLEPKNDVMCEPLVKKLQKAFTELLRGLDEKYPERWLPKPTVATAAKEYNDEEC